MESGKYYVVGYGNNLIEGMTKEQILAAITQAVESHEISDVDTGFVTTLKEHNSGNGLKLWVGTTAQYNAITTPETNCLYILSDDTELEDIEELVESLEAKVDGIADLKGAVILNELVNYGDSLSVDLLDDITKYTEVIVTVPSVMGDVLCTVSQLSTVIKIKGVGVANNSSSNTTVIVCINLSVSKANNKLTANNSTAVLFLGQTEGTINELNINKIVGVY